MTRTFKTIVEFDPAERVWVTYVPALNHLSTFGETRAEALEQTREAILGYLEAAKKEGIAIPGPEQEPEIAEVEVPA